MRAQATELGQVTARCAREHGSAVNTLNKCVLSAEHEKDFLEKKRKNEVADAARALVAKKEADGAKAIEKVTSAWDERIELRVAAEEKMKVARGTGRAPATMSARACVASTQPPYSPCAPAARQGQFRTVWTSFEQASLGMHPTGAVRPSRLGCIWLGMNTLAI